MTLDHAKKTIAILLLAAVGACSSGASNGQLAGTNPLPDTTARHTAKKPRFVGYLVNMVGVGDSLTAGYQAGGFLGATNVKNPLNSFPPNNVVPPGQESGWWSDVWEEAQVALGRGTLTQAVNAVYNPALSPMPLVAGPGLNNQVVSSATSVIGELKSGTSAQVCSADNGFNQDGYSLSGFPRVRMNPYSTLVRDFGVPGITLHEANQMTQPLSPTCQNLPGSAGLLSQIVAGESSTFYSVLGGFVPHVQDPTMVHVADSVTPSFATVWLGANDLLKFMGTGGRFLGGDMTPGQAESDLRTTIYSLQQHGAAGIVVANLPNVLHLAYFMNMQPPPSAKACLVQQYFQCLLIQFGTPPGDAAVITRGLAAKYGLAAPGCVGATTTQPCGYLTLSGALTVVAALAAQKPIPTLDPSGPGSGLGGNYITPSLAGKIQNLNNNLNSGIAAAAQASNVPMVDVATIIDGIASGNPSNPYFRQAAGINPGVCCSLVFLGGFLSFDGLHPSNTGYATIAYYFIKTMNASYQTGLSEVSIRAIYSGKAPYRFADPYAPQIVHDLEIVPNGHGGLTLRHVR